MAQTIVNICMDEDLKRQFESFCSEIGISMTTAFCIFAQTAVRERRIPFELSIDRDQFYSAENMARLKKAAADLDVGRGTVHELIDDGDENEYYLKLYKDAMEEYRKNPVTYNMDEMMKELGL